MEEIDALKSDQYKLKQAAGPNGTSFINFGIDTITEITNEMYNGEINICLID